MEVIILSGFNYKVARIKARIKAIDFAQGLGISPSKLSLFENGYCNLKPEIVDRIDNKLKQFM